MNSYKPLLFISISVFVGLLPYSALAQFSSSTNFQIQAGVVDSLGDYSSSTSFQLFGNIPYIEAGNTTSSNFQVNVGFPFTSSVSAIVVSSQGSVGGITSGSIPDILQTPTSTDIASLLAILESLRQQANSLLIQTQKQPSFMADIPEEELPANLVDLYDRDERINRPIIRRIPILSELPQVSEIYKRLVQTRFIPAFIVLLIVILIFFRRKR